MGSGMDLAANTHILALMEAYSLTGPAKNLLRLARYFNTEGPVRVSIATFARGNADNSFIRTATEQRIPIHVLKEKRRFDLAPWVAFRQLLAGGEFTLVQSHGVKAHLFAATARGSLPWLAYHHGYTAEDWKMRLYNRINRVTLPRAGLVLTVCQPFRERLITEGVTPSRIRVLPNSLDEALPADPAMVEQWRSRLGLNASTGMVLLTVGRLSSEKGHRDLLTALGALSPQLPPWRLLILGDGPERQNLEQQSQQLGLTGKVHFLGHHTHAGPFYRLADVFLLPSLSEGSSNALLEAMLSGLCCVASRVGGNPETLVDQQSGLLLPPSQPEQWTATLTHLLSNPSLLTPLGEAAQKRVQEHFSFPVYRERILAAYDTLQRS